MGGGEHVEHAANLLGRFLGGLFVMDIGQQLRGILQGLELAGEIALGDGLGLLAGRLGQFDTRRISTLRGESGLSENNRQNQSESFHDVPPLYHDLPGLQQENEAHMLQP